MRKLYLSAALALFGMARLLAGDPGPTGPTTKSILYGGSAILWPHFQNGNGAIDHGVGPVTSGTSYTVSPLVDTVYTLTITNDGGDTATQTVTVNVATVTMAAVSPATKTISCTKSFAFGGAAVSGAVDPSIAWSVDGVPGGNASVGTITSGGNYTAPATPGAHTVRATSNANGAVYQEASVTVVALPSIDSALTATPSSVNYGGTSVLTATFSNGTATLVGGSDSTSPTSPINHTTPALSATTTYTLTVTNAAGDSVTGTATVTVSNVTITPLAPLTKTLSLTKTLQMTGGVVSGSVDASVTWSVVQGAGYGTIDGNGLYTAPATMPGGGSTVTIRCTSTANPAVYTEATITLVPLPVIDYFVVE